MIRGLTGQAREEAMMMEESYQQGVLRQAEEILRELRRGGRVTEQAGEQIENGLITLRMAVESRCSLPWGWHWDRIAGAYTGTVSNEDAL